MKSKIRSQICELKKTHRGLTDISLQNRKTVIKGPLSFEASFDGFPVITDCFDIELVIPSAYPEVLPVVREIGGRIDQNYEHLNQDGTLCLATPIEKRLFFLEQESLLGFVNHLVIPYLYGYCYWKKYGQHPFGERAHGVEGIIEYYRDDLGLGSHVNILAMLAFLFEYGYRGHLSCPCKSGFTVRECHSEVLLQLHRHHSKDTLKNDFFILLFSLRKEEEIPEELAKQIQRILEKKNSRKKVGARQSLRT